MPTTKDIRSIKITSNVPRKGSTPKIMLACGIALAVLYFLGCKTNLLPGSMCGNSKLDSNTPPLTPVATDTPLGLAIEPPVEQLPACGLSLYVPTPACGAVYSVNAGNPNFTCGRDGTSIMTLDFTVSGEAAKKILEQQGQGAFVQTQPAGICQWTSVEPTGIEGEYKATLQCFGTSGETVQILEGIGGSSCQIAPPCPSGYALDASQLQSEGEYFCIKNENLVKNTSCAEGSYVNTNENCCQTKPVGDLIFACPNGQIDGNSINCGVVSDSVETLREGYTLPYCPILDPQRPTEENNSDNAPATACVPDATGGGCP